MKSMTAATTRSPVARTRQNAAVAVLRRCGEMLARSLKGVGAAWCDPMTCNAYWIGGSPAVWGSRK